MRIKKWWRTKRETFIEAEWEQGFWIWRKTVTQIFYGGGTVWQEWPSCHRCFTHDEVELCRLNCRIEMGLEDEKQCELKIVRHESKASRVLRGEAV